MLLGDADVGVPGEDDLALLGDLESAVDRARRLGGDRPVQRATPTTEGSSAAVEQGQCHLVARRPFDEGLLGAVQCQGRRGRADVLGRVRVPEHDLDLTVDTLEPRRRRRQAHPPLEGRVGSIEVGAGLEQRNDVEGERPCADGEPSEGSHGDEVAGALAERDDVPAAAALTPALLQPRHDAQRVEHLARRRTRCGSEFGPAVDREVVEEGRVRCGRSRVGDLTGKQGDQLGERRPVHGTVLTHLELGEVEAEGLQHPDDVLQLAARGPGVAGGDERLLHEQEVRERLVRPGVRQARLLSTGRVEPGGHDEQLLPVRLTRGVLADLGQQAGVACSVVGQGVTQRRGRGSRLLVHGDHPGNPVDGLVQDLQGLVGVSGHGLAGHLGRHEGVSVAIPTHPGTEADHRRQRGGIRCLATQGRLHGPLELRDRVHEGLAEDRQHGLDLVRGGGAGDAQGGGALEDVDVVEHAAAGVRTLRRARLGVVVDVEVGRDPPQRGRHRAAPGLGRVSREHRVDPHGRDPCPGVRP